MSTPDPSFYEFFCPVKILAGVRALEHVPFELRALGATRPMLITDRGVRDAGLADAVRAALEEGGVTLAASYDEVPPDSSTSVVATCARAYRAAGCDSILALGGGSVIDSAKGVNVLVSEQTDDLSAFVGSGALTRRLRPLFVVPTTAGTGSEVTLAAVITDDARGVKLAFTSPFLLPDVAVLDPRMTLTLPPHVTAATAMDALTHAVEAYICLGKNPISDGFATAAIAKISRHLVPVLDDPSDVTHRLELAQAATLAGIAFSNSMTGLVHAVGHQLGAVCHLHHGVCMSLVLPYALEYNRAARGDAIGELLLPLEGADVYARTPSGRRADETIASIRRLRDVLYERCKIPRTLSETGKVRRDQLETLARMAIDDGPLAYNPEDVSFEDALALLERAW